MSTVYEECRVRAVQALKARIAKAKEESSGIGKLRNIIGESVDHVLPYRTSLSHEQSLQFLHENPDTLDIKPGSEVTIGQAITQRIRTAIVADLDAAALRRAFREDEW